MRAWTYTELLAKVQTDLDLEDTGANGFIQTAEMLAYFNEAIDEAEAEILKIHEDYFLDYDAVSLVSGTAEYSLDSTIYASKIRAIIYANGPLIYEVKRVKGQHKFLELADTAQGGSQDEYRYWLRNESASTGVKMVLSPASRETSATVMTVYYIRNANRLTTGSDTLDIPEFADFVLQYVKVRCYEKEMNPNLQFAVGALEQQRKLMVDTLTNRVPDDDDEIPPDTSHYQEHT